MSWTITIEATMPDGRRIEATAWNDGVNGFENALIDIDGLTVPAAIHTHDDDDEDEDE